VRLFIIVITLLLLTTGCSRYTIGAENAAPRVVSGNAEMAMAEHSEAGAGAETSEEADHNSALEDTDHSGEAAHSEEVDHSASLPELDTAMGVVRESFAHVRGSRTARHEAATQLETTREALHTLSETGAISHWSELDEHFEVAIEKVLEGTNDAPNALNRLLTHLEEAGQH
jgi:hypothetical protein